MELFYKNWHELVPNPWANICLAIIAAMCGSISGAERERKEKPAGLRTLSLVSLGAAVFTMVSIALNPSSPSYVAAQIVTGVGFLGAGAILRGTIGVIGLTTAATIWMAAATGMVVGAGYAGAGLALSLLVLALLTVIGSWEHRYVGQCQFTSVVLTFDPAGGKTIVRMEDIIDDFHTRHRLLEQKTPEGWQQLALDYCKLHRHHREFLAQLAAMPEVKEIRREASSKL